MRPRALAALDTLDKFLEKMKEKGVAIFVTDHLDIPHHGAPLILVEDLSKLEIVDDVIAVNFGLEEHVDMLVIRVLGRYKWLYILYEGHFNLGAATFRLTASVDVKRRVVERVKELKRKWG